MAAAGPFNFCYFAVSPALANGTYTENTPNGPVPFIYVKFGDSRNGQERQTDYPTHNPSVDMTVPGKDVTGFGDNGGFSGACGTFMRRRIFEQHKFTKAPRSTEWIRVYDPDMDAVRTLFAGWNTAAYDFGQYTIEEQKQVADDISVDVFPPSCATP